MASEVPVGMRSLQRMVQGLCPLLAAAFDTVNSVGCDPNYHKGGKNSQIQGGFPMEFLECLSRASEFGSSFSATIPWLSGQFNTNLGHSPLVKTTRN